jgi:hypothetical protein
MRSFFFLFSLSLFLDDQQFDLQDSRWSLVSLDDKSVGQFFFISYSCILFFYVSFCI